VVSGRSSGKPWRVRRRYAPAGLTQHVVQRGVNRMRVFFSDAHRADYLSALAYSAARYGCAIHAYVLMDNHTHILATPECAGALSGMMQWLGARFVTGVNATESRTGSLWESRFWSSVVTTESYVMICHRYIELNPVRAGIVADPAQYPWSSHRCNALGLADPIVTTHDCYRRLAATQAECRRAYRSLFGTSVSESDVKLIRDALNGRRWLGDAPSGAGHLRRGRPRRERCT
jgi:putative transposase